MDKASFFEPMNTYIGEPVLATIKTLTDIESIEHYAMVEYHIDQQSNDYRLCVLALAPDAWFMVNVSIYGESEITRHKYNNIASVTLRTDFNMVRNNSGRDYHDSLVDESVSFDYGAQRITIPAQVETYNQRHGLRELAAYISSKLPI